ncbi:EH domain-binding protein 1 [Papilio machaon]|uniref:EH domain-binding protein 1 n=1 Tax=Papilio machaon TaxID=76193 RepID=A0A0N1IGP0_PAPMA|nr:EH domain-binding protein 1 [Papilio machaon]
MEEMTQSLTNSDIAATPNSVQSLNFDNSPTPTAPITPTTDTPTNPATPTSPATPTPNNKDIDLTPKDTNIKRPEYNNFTKMTIKTESPKFTSTPKAEEPVVDNFKAMQFKPKTIAKKNLKPLELKSNLNNISLDTNENEKGDDSEKTPVVDMEKLFPLKGLDKDKTPMGDIEITNLTTSFRSGLAFCAIIHRFRPDLIDFSGLQPEEAERNLRVALEASARLGISQVLTAADVCARPAPDKLAIMTYLFQLRAHFTGSELQVEQLGNDETESSYLVGRHDTDGGVPRDLFSREVSERRSRMRTRPRPNSQDSDTKSQERASPEKTQSPAPIKDVRDMLVQQSKTILGKMLSPARDLKTREPNTKWFTDPPTVPEPIPARPEKLMTRKELTDPFGSDEEEEPAPPPAQETITNETVKVESKPAIEPAVTDPLTSLHEASPPKTTAQQEEQNPAPDLPKPTPQLLSRHDELKERARQLLEATKREAREKEKNRRQNSKEKEEANKTEMVNGLRNGDASPTKKPMTEEERQAMLRERARKLIADARAGIVSPTSPLSPSRSRGTVEIISKQSVMEELAAAGEVEQLEALAGRGDTPPTPPTPGSRSYGSADRSGMFHTQNP